MISQIKSAVMNALPKRLAGYLRAWRIRASLKQFEPRWVTHDYAGQRLSIRLEDCLGEGWYDNDWKELPEVTLLASYRLRSGARVFDIGAHQGIVAMMMANKVGAGGSVVAVEANPHNARIANMNLERNRIDNVSIVSVAVSNYDGTIVFNEGLNGQVDDGTGWWGRQTVSCRSIDSLAKEFGFPDVVFLDVEGAEGMALQGASETLARGADFFVEVHVGWGLEQLGGSVEQILAFFPSDRYERLVRNDECSEFRTVSESDPIFKSRFYLIAILRSDRPS